MTDTRYQIRREGGVIRPWALLRTDPDLEWRRITTCETQQEAIRAMDLDARRHVPVVISN